jgi:hypothetical protein
VPDERRACRRGALPRPWGSLEPPCITPAPCVRGWRGSPRLRGRRNSRSHFGG